MAPRPFAYRIREHRRARGLTQRELASAVDLSSVSFLSALENGRAFLPEGLMHRLARALELPMPELLLGNGRVGEE